MEKLLDVEQAAELLNKTPRTVRRLLQRGEIVGTKFGKEWRVPAEQFRFDKEISEQRQRQKEAA